MKLYATLILLLFASLRATAQSPKHVDTLLQQAQTYAAKGNTDSAEIVFRQAGAMAKKLDYTDGLFEYTGKYANLLYIQSRYQEAMDVSRQQLDLAQRTNNKKKIAQSYNNIGLQYQSLGDLRTAADYYIKALQLSEELSDPVNQQKYNTNLSSVFYDMRDKEKSLYYARKGYEVAVAIKDTGRITRSLINVIISEVLNEDFTAAIAHSREIIDMGSKADPDALMTAYNNLGDIYHRLKKYNEALVNYRRALSLVQETGADGYTSYIYFGMANSYTGLKDYLKANEYFKLMGDWAERELPKADLQDYYKLGAELKGALGEYKTALDFSNKYTVLHDSITNASTQTAVHEMETRYQTSQKEKAIAQQKLKISDQLNEISRKDKWIWLSVSAVIVLLLVVLVIWFSYQQRKRTAAIERTNQLLQASLSGEEKALSKTAKELHDGVGSILAAAKMHLYTQEAEVTQKVIGLVDTALQEVRHISHNLSPEVVLSGGLEYAVRNYCSRVSHPGLTIECYTMGDLPKMGPDTGLIIYRVVQEALTNILKHAGATQVIVQLSYDRGLLSVTIEDDGKGFDMQEAKQNGIGIGNMHTRVQLLKGSCQVTSAPGQGTTVYFEVMV
ncbi:sensor histidine kinase [uncultured Chitinophaga sp.]|uniref:tetratricopeptide repeat-containing sensor histidine kinase n=1 Tax=uncultured Chitinophaga sp. TaxID=339340 RepID=UPI0025FB9958|nr:sensor histidine kinase [uncultured Chitinophaga sp.]